MKTSTPYRNPIPTVDIILRGNGNTVVLIQRANPPLGWALPGGFVDEGESCETAAKREAQEELSVPVTLHHQQGTYSDPSRDPRMHTLSVVFVASTPDESAVKAGDGAAEAHWFTEVDIPWAELCFDHDVILRDYFQNKGPCSRNRGQTL
jgi:8-oxo-dGTP diphosphatase